MTTTKLLAVIYDEKWVSSWKDEFNCEGAADDEQ